MREFLKGLDLDDELIDTIMAEHGKLVTKDKEKIKELEETTKNASELQQKYDALSKTIEETEAKKKADNIEKSISDIIGDKKFANDYTKQAIINEVKNALENQDNVGKSTKDIFDAIVEGKEGIFVNPNQPLPGMSENINTEIDKEAFKKMGYQERILLKQENPELFTQLNTDTKEE